ncbi:hypothetical protein [Pseudomonas coronafaciens]|uniref:hypothetical protein n=1 Tax=Pseudomonas coronafaciens TaxID=53409 RepID=UPI0037B7419C
MKHTLKHLIYFVCLAFTLLIAVPTFADDSGVSSSQTDSTSSPATSSGVSSPSDGAGTGTSVDALTQRERLVSTGIWLVQKFATLSGLLIFLAFFVRLAKYADAQGTQNRPSVSSLYIFAISGIMLFSYSSTLGTLITTISGKEGDGVCYVVESADLKLNSLNNCWSDASSEISGELSASVTKLSGNSDVMTEFRENTKVGIGLLQLIGFMFFCFSVHAFVEIGKGTARHGYTKPIVMMIAASLIVDLPHTAEMVLATLKSVGVTFSA